MGLNLKNVEVEQLATEVAGLTGETKTQAIRVALTERKARLQAHGGGLSNRGSIREFLEREIWTTIPADKFGRELSREEEDTILGYGPGGF